MRYFAYGSNMSIRRLRDRVPSAEFLCIATLFGHELRLHKTGRDGSGKCDAYATDDAAHGVVGVIYEIQKVEKALLDKKEGLGVGYGEKVVELALQTGEIVSALTYYATRIDTRLKPYDWYKYHVITGATEHALPGDYTARLNRIESVADPDSDRHEREMAIYRDR